MFRHTYASLAEAMNWARDNGAATLWSSASTNNAEARKGLESASRRVDAWCERSKYGSGFGPRTGVNRYDGIAGAELILDDDLISTSPTVLSRPSTGASGTSLTLNTDFYLRNQRKNYEPGPYRTIILHGVGVAAFGSGFRVTEVTGSWGYSDNHDTLTATMGVIITTTETTLTPSAVTEVSAGQTLLVDSEQMYVTSKGATTIVVERGANGTTAATHLAAAPIALYRYDPDVQEATKRLWLKRWRSRDAGADGSDGNGEIGLTVARESEDTILRRAVGHLKLGAKVAVS